MASRELVVAIFADAGPFEKGMLSAAKSTKILTYAVDDMAAKNVAAMTVEMTKLKELQGEYMKLGAAATKGSTEAVAATKLLTDTNRRLGLQVKTTGSLMHGLARNFTSVGKSLTTYVTLPIAIAAAAATKMFINFQRQMEMIHTQAGASQAEVKRASKDLLNYAASGKSPVDQTELAKGLFFLESRGLRGAKALEAVKIAAQAAGLGMAGMEDVANALGGAIITGIKGTKNYSQAMGIINATVGGGAMRLADYADALKTGVVPAAKAAGISLVDVGAALDVMTDRGMPAQLSATRLRMTFSMMQKPTKDGAKALKDLGIGQNQLAETLKQPNGLLKAMELLQAGIDKMKDKTRAYGDVLQAFGKGRSSAGVLTLLNSLSSSSSSLQGKIAQIEKQQKTFARDVAAYHQTAAYKVSAAWNAVKANLTKMGGVIAPAFAKIVEHVAKLVSWFEKLPKPVKQAAGYFALAVAALGPLLFLGGKIISVFTGVTGIMVKAAILSKVLFTGMSVEAAETAVAIDSALISTGIGALIVAIGVVTAYMIFHWEKVKKWFIAFGKWMKDHAGLLLVIPVLGPMLFAVTKIITYWGTIKKAVQNAVNAMVKILKEVVGKIEKIFKPLIDFFKKTFGAIFTWIENKFMSIFKKVGGWISKVAGWMHIDSITNAFKSVFWNTGQASGQAFSQAFMQSLDISNVLNPSQIGTQGGSVPATTSLGGSVFYRNATEAAAKAAGIPPELFLRQINQESGFDPNAKSSAGALGIAQFMPGTAAGYKINPLDPSQALPAAARMMAGLYKKYKDWGLALAAYNAGEHAVDLYLAGLHGLPSETTNYVKTITGVSLGTRSSFDYTKNKFPGPIGPNNNPMSQFIGDQGSLTEDTKKKVISGLKLLSKILQKEIIEAGAQAIKGNIKVPAFPTHGIVKAGNINLFNRPNVPTPGEPGFTSSIRSITVGIGKGLFALIPTVVGNKVVSNKAAIAHYQQTGQQLGVFTSEKAADAYGKRLHEQQATLGAERQLIALDKQGIAYLEAHYRGAKKTTIVIKEEAVLKKEIERINNKINAAEDAAGKARERELKVLAAQAKKAAQEAMGRAERSILNLGSGTNAEASTNAFKGTVRQKLQAINEEVKTWGITMQGSTKSSIAAINKVLKYDFIPPDVRENLKARLEQIKQTVNDEMTAIQQVMKDKADALKSLSLRVFSAVSAAADTVFNTQTQAQVQQMVNSMNAEVTAMTDAMNSEINAMQTSLNTSIQQMQDSATEQVKNLQITVQSSFGSFLFGGSITQTPGETLLKSLQDAQQQNQTTLAVLEAQSTGDIQALHEAQLQQMIDAAQKQADAERTAADTQYTAAQDALQKQLDLRIQDYQTNQQLQIDAKQKEMQINIDAYQAQAELAQAAYQAQRDAQQAEMDLELADQLTMLENGQINYQTYVANVEAILTANAVNSETIAIATGQGLVYGLLPGINAAISLWNQYSAAMNAALSGGTSATAGVSMIQSAAQSILGFTHFADGGIVTRPTLAMIGEAGEPEGVFPLSKLGNFGSFVTEELHIHFDGPVIGSDLRQAARDLAPAIRAEIIKTQKRNHTSGII